MPIAAYPGSFDPVTNGHLDIIRRSAALFDRVIVAIFKNIEKKPMFTVEERIAMVREATRDLKNVEVTSSSGLLVDFCRMHGVKIVIKGLRAVSDFDYEFQMAQMNKELNEEVETLFMMTRTQHLFLSSSVIKEIARFGGNVRPFVPEGVYARLTERVQALKGDA